MIDCQNLGVAQQQQSQQCFACLPESRVIEKQRMDDEDSRISTDYDLYLESEEEDMDEDDYRSTFSTFSALLMRRLHALKEQQQEQEIQQPVRPPVLTIADDSYSAKMERVFKWTRAVSAAPSEDVSSDSDYSPPTLSRKRRLSDASSPDNSIIKRVRTSDGLSPAAPGTPLLPPKSRMYHHRPEYTLPTLDIPSKAYLARNDGLRRCVVYPPRAALPAHVCTACDTFFPSPQRLRRHGRGADACRAAVTYGLDSD